MLLAKPSRPYNQDHESERTVCFLDFARISPRRSISIVHIVDDKDFASAPYPYLVGKIRNEKENFIEKFYRFEPRIAYCLVRHFREKPFSCSIVTEKNDSGFETVIAISSELFTYDCRNPETFPDGHSDPSIQCPHSENPHSTARLEIRHKSIQKVCAKIIPFSQKTSTLKHENADEKPGRRPNDHE